MKFARTFARTPKYVLTGGLAIIFVFPLLWSGYASVAPQSNSSQEKGFGLGNYQTLFEYNAGLPQFLLNSLTAAVLTVIFTLVLSILAGYAFARFNFPGKNVLFLLVLAILMVPYATLLIPLYVLLANVGLSNSLFGLSLVLTLFQLPFSVFMMRISFEAVPIEIEESALMDGCTTFGALRRVLLPAVMPGVVTVGLFSFLAAWNDFIAPMILINDSSTFTLPVAVSTMAQGAFGSIDYGATEAGVVVLALPCIILFIVLQRFYVQGFMSGALKG